MLKERSLEVLNDLVKVNTERIKNFVTASSNTDEVDLIIMFSQFIDNSKKCVSELIKEIHGLNKMPNYTQTNTGKFFKLWNDVKASVMTKSRNRLLNMCYTGEYETVSIYKTVLEKEGNILSPEQLELIESQRRIIEKDRITLKKTRDIYLFGKLHAELF